MPIISVIVPVYKVEPYLRRCVDSILGQTFSDFELILVDDGSPDSCPIICDEYAKRDPRVHVIHKTNGGLSSARNAGLATALGTFVLFCDSDDYVSKDWIALMYGKVKKNPTAYVVCNIYRVSGSCREPAVDPNLRPPQTISYFDIYKMGLSPYAWNKIFHRATLISHQLQFDESCSYAEDVAFSVDYFKCCTEVTYISEPLYFYEQTPGSIMHRYTPKLLEYHLPLFYIRLSVVEPEHLEEYCDIFLYTFLRLFPNVFDPQCGWTLLKKLRYNQKILHTKEFRYCLTHASGQTEFPLLLFVLHIKNYYLYWLIERLCEIKGRLTQ